MDGHVKRIAVVSTGGTIEKTYDEYQGILANKVNVLDVMLASLQLRGIAIERVSLMNKDSLEMSDDDHAQIAEAAHELAERHDGVVIVHGTDALATAVTILAPSLAIPAFSYFRPTMKPVMFCRNNRGIRRRSQS